MPAKCLVEVHKNSRTKRKKTSWASIVHISNPTYYFDFHNSAHEPRATCSILEARTNVTKKNDRILIKDLISYKLKHGTKEARLILQSAFIYFLLPIFRATWPVLICVISKKVYHKHSHVILFLYLFFLNSSAFHLNSFWKNVENSISIFWKWWSTSLWWAKYFYKQPWLNQLILDRFLTMWISFRSDFLLLIADEVVDEGLNNAPKLSSFFTLSRSSKCKLFPWN